MGTSGLEKLPRKMAAGHLFLLLFHQPVSGQDYQIGGDYQIQAAEDDYDYDYQNAIANANANANERHRGLPWEAPVHCLDQSAVPTDLNAVAASAIPDCPKN